MNSKENWRAWMIAMLELAQKRQTDPAVMLDNGKWLQNRPIALPEELEELPALAVILSSGYIVYQKLECYDGKLRWFTPTEVLACDPVLPGHVIYEGDYSI